MDKKLEKKLQSEGILRTVVFDRSTLNEEDRTIDISFSSEEPVERFDWWDGVTFDEILSHDKKSIRLERINSGGSVRDTHYGDQIAVVEKAYLDDKTKKLRALVRFSKSTPRANEVFGDVTDGIRKNVSFRYKVYAFEEKKNDAGKKQVTATDWEPIHISFEPDPADYSVGVGRSQQEREPKLNFDDESFTTIVDKKIEERINKIKLQTNLKENEMTEEEKRAAEEKAAKEKAEAEARAATVKLDREAEEKIRTKSIQELTEKFKDKVSKVVNLEEMRDLFLSGNKSAEAFSDLIIENLQKQSALQKAAGHVDMSEKNIMDYSISRAMRNMIEGKRGFEHEISDQAAKQLEKSTTGIIIPENVLVMKKLAILTERELKALGISRRDLTAGGTGTGAELVGTTHAFNELIGILYNRTLAFRMGVRRMPNQIADLSIPILSSGASFGWASTETANLAESTPVTSSLSLTPKRGGTYVDVSNQGLRQMQPAVDALVTDDLMMAVELGIDLAFFHGSGSSGQPTGLANTSGIGSVAGASLGWSGALEFEEDIETANANVLTMYFATTPAIKRILKSRTKISSDGSQGFICEPNNSVNGYPLEISNQVSAGNIFFGDYSQGVIPMWGAVDLRIDSTSKANSIAGLTTFVVEAFIDIGIRRAGAFSRAQNVT